MHLRLLLLVAHAAAFYLPGVAPTDYEQDEQIPLLVNHLTPGTFTQKNGRPRPKTLIYLYDYYYPKFRFCQPEGGPKKQLELLGAIIFGDRIFLSPFDLRMKHNVECQVLCETTYLGADAAFVNRNIRQGYYHNWLVDGLPVAHKVKAKDDEYYSTGFPIGEVSNQDALLYNHFQFNVEYHERRGKFRVVGVTVKLLLLDRTNVDTAHGLARDICGTVTQPMKLNPNADTKVVWLYEVSFDPSATPWATRWDKYLHVYDPKIQWMLLINFSLVVVILGIIMTHILVTTLKNDFIKYNEVNLDEDVAYESGWKLVYGDVFRLPPNRMLLLVLVGLGAHLFCMVVATIVFALFGLLSPSNRGALSTFMFIVFIFFSFISAYVSGYLYRFFGGENWKLNMLLTPTLVPGCLFAAFVLLNFFLINVHSLGAIPAGTLLAIILIWFAVLFPMSVAGTLMQLRRLLLSVPVRTNQIPRQVPAQPWYLRTVPAMLISGLFPFGLIAVELYFIFSLIWFNRIYYMFGFLFFCFVLMILTTSLVAVLYIYHALCCENYRWHWKAVFIGGGCAIYVFLHLLMFVKNSLLGFTLVVLYVGYSAVISVLVFLVCGSVGFLTNLFFIRRIFSQIKID